jgi:hypothetical protein
MLNIKSLVFVLAVWLIASVSSVKAQYYYQPHYYQPYYYQQYNYNYNLYRYNVYSNYYPVPYYVNPYYVNPYYYQRGAWSAWSYRDMIHGYRR